MIGWNKSLDLLPGGVAFYGFSIPFTKILIGVVVWRPMEDSPVERKYKCQRSGSRYY